MEKDDALSYDPWQELAKSRQVKDVSLDEALEKLNVAEEEAPVVKRDMLDKVHKITKKPTTTNTKSKSKPKPKPKKTGK
jgi:hypothetical protein